MANRGLFRSFMRPGQEVYLIRYKPGVYRDGIYHGQREFRRRLAPGSYSVQPLSGDDVSAMPDGLTRVTSSLKVFAEDKLIPGDDKRGIQADQLEIDGVLYSVDIVQDFNFGRLAHFEAIVVKVTT